MYFQASMMSVTISYLSLSIRMYDFFFLQKLFQGK